MTLHTIFLLILLYFAFKAARNLLRAVQEDRAAGARAGRQASRNAQTTWQGEAPRRTRHREDVEDARWVDL